MRRREAGFTLLEMLVALVVFGLVMAGLAQAFRFGLTSWSAETRASAGPEEMAAVDIALRRMIGKTVPGSLVGGPNGLAFTTKLPDSAGLSNGLADVSLVVARGDRLVLRFVPHPAGIPLGPPPAVGIELLANGVLSLRAAYLTPQSEGPPVWADRWTRDDLPLLVRLHIQFVGNRTWPDLVAAPVDTGPDTVAAPVFTDQ